MKERTLPFSFAKGFRAVNIRPAVVGIMAFLLGRAVLFEVISPFALAFLAAFVSSRPKKAFQSTVIGFLGIAGSMTVFPDVRAIKYCLAFVLFGLVYISVTTLTDSRKNFAVSAIAAISLLISGIISLAQNGFALYYFIMLVLESAACLALVIVMERGIPTLYRDNSDPAFFYGMAVLCVLGISGISVWGVSVLNTVCILILMLVSYAGGVTAGCIGGIVVGTAAGINAFPFTQTLGVFSLCGLIGGLMHRFKRPGVLLGFIISNALLSMYMGGFDGGTFTIYELIIAGAIFLALPQRVCDSLQRTLQEHMHSQKADKLAATIAKKLGNAAKAFGELATTFRELAVPKVKTNMHDIATVFDITADRICRSCTRKFYCWEKKYHTTCDVMMNLTPTLEKEGKVCANDFPSFFRESCIRINDLVREINSQYLQRLDVLHYKQQLAQSRELMADQFDNVSKIIGSIAKENDTECAKAVDVVCAAAAKIKEGETDSGDSFVYQPISDNKYILVLSDGMGTGSAAAGQSNTAISLLRKLLDAGYDKASAIKMINAVLLVRSSEECFATMDMMMLDQSKGYCELVKIGACPTYIKRGERVKAIASTSLPAGILTKVDMETYAVNVEKGDYIIMLSDGIEDVGNSWLNEFLQQAPEASAKAMADAILQTALDMKNGTAADDMTVMVARIV